MHNISRSSTPPTSAPVSPLRSPEPSTRPVTPSHDNPASPEDSAAQAQSTRQRVVEASRRGSAHVNQALERFRLQQQEAAQALAAEALEDSRVVTPQALKWTRALVIQGPITVEPAHVPSGATLHVTGISEFDNEQMIAESNEMAMQPFLVAARNRLRSLENPPVTQQQCDELREQLELQHNEPDAYDIRDANGEQNPVEFQTLRAYSEALLSVEALHLPALLNTLNHVHHISDHELHLVLRHHYNVPNLHGLVQMIPALTEADFSRNEILRIAAHWTGVNNMRRALDLVTPLRAMGFTTRQVARMAANPNGHHNLLTAATLSPDLLRSGATHSQITRAGASADGAYNLRELAAEVGSRR